jgi:glutamate mutase epsilon subunit
MEAVQQAPQSVPEVKQIRWIRNIVDEPMQLRRGTPDPFGSVSPLGVELPLMAC